MQNLSRQENEIYMVLHVRLLFTFLIHHPLVEDLGLHRGLSCPYVSVQENLEDWSKENDHPKTNNAYMFYKYNINLW